MIPLTSPNRSIFLRVMDEVNAALERHFWLFAALLVVQVLVYAIEIDISTKMWFDELFTLHMAQQASPGEIVKASLGDVAPPLYPIIVHAILPWVRQAALAVRLPATLGYCGMVVFVLAFCRRRLPAGYTFAAALLACNAFLYYATEGRSYGLVMGCAAAALFFWQAAAEGSRRVLTIPLLAICLALMVALHYYSIFFLVPLSVAEFVRWRRSGRLDVAVPAAMAPALLVLGLHYPFVVASRQFQEHYTSQAAWSQIPEVYLSYFVRMGLLPICVLVAFSLTSYRRRALWTGLKLPEWVACVAFSLMPLFVVVVSKYTTHVFIPRYTLWTVPGIVVLVMALLYAAVRGEIAVGVSMLALLVVLLVLQEMNGVHEKPGRLRDEAVRQELASLPDGPRPVVIANCAVFLELSYYSAPPLRDRLIYPVSSSLELGYLGTNTRSLAMSVLSRSSKLQIINYDEVLSAHPRFLLAAIPQDYLPQHLLKAGYRVIPISSSSEAVLYDVESPTGK